MDPTGEIDLDRKRLVCSSSDIAKLPTPDGCQLSMVTNKVHGIADDDDDFNVGSSDSELDDVFNEAKKEDQAQEELKARESRIKKEFISLVLNANRDPVKPGTRFRFKDFQEAVRDDEFECDTRNLEHGFIGIHRQYENMGSYDHYMSEHNFEEVSPGRVFKLKRVTGVQLPVSEDTIVIYNCAFWTQNSKEPFDSTWLRRTTITTHLAVDSILPGLRELLLTCKQGELCEAFIRPEAAFGPLGVKPRIPPNATIFSLLEVVKVVSRDKYAVITLRPGENQPGLLFEDLYEASDEARRRGNYFFEQKLYRIALQRYKSGIRLLEYMPYKDRDEELKGGELLVRLYNNCARTANAMGCPRLALAACKQARLISDQEPKTHWHRMTAWSKMGQTDRAMGVARRALLLFEGDSNVVRAFQRSADDLKIKLQKEQAEVEELHRLMGQALVSTA